MKFSIITITYNSEKSIRKTMESVLNQSYTDFEYIVIDGASEDNTLNIENEYKEKFQDNKIPFTLISERDEGISDAFNKGIIYAKGDYIGIINSGDELTRNALEIIDREITNDPNVDVIYGNIIWIENGAQRVRKSRQDLDSLKYDMIIMHPSVFIKKQAYDMFGTYKTDYRYAMDQELLYRLYYNKCRFKYIDFEVAIMEAGGVSDRNVWAVLKESCKIPHIYNKFDPLSFFFLVYRYIKNRLSKLVRTLSSK